MLVMVLIARRYGQLINLLLLCLICFNSEAQGNAHPITIKGEGIPLKTIFKAIRKQTGFAVMYNTATTELDQEQKITVAFKDTPLDEVLNHLFKERGLGWTYNDNVVVLFRKVSTTPRQKEVDSTIQPALLTGMVTDASGNPLPGVTVQVKGGVKGTTTDAQGRFSLTKIANDDVLVISSVGFETRYLQVKGRSVLAKLNLLVSGLDETVIIAYGTTTKRLLVGNINTIKGEEISKQPVNNVLLALQGRVPGLFITQNTGVPGGDLTVRIQGQNSIGKGNDPLYIVDGVPFPAQLAKINSSIQGDYGGSPLQFINPADIASVDILKDADATAIYGSRAANGAILITTKRGAAGRIKIDLNIQQGWSEVPYKVKMLDTRQYLDMRYEAFKNDGKDWRQPAVSANDLKVWDTTRYTDWQEVLIGNTAPYTNVNVSVSGGSPTTRFLVGGNWREETTVFPGDYKDRKGSLHFNLNGSSQDQKFNIQFSGNYMVGRNYLPSFDLTPAAVRIEPNAPPLYNSDHTLNWAPDEMGMSTWNNPLAEYTTQKNKSSSNNLVGSMLISYSLIRGMQMRCSAGYTRNHTNNILTVPLSGIRPEWRPFSFRYGFYGDNTFSSWIVEPQISYNKSIGKGVFEGLIGSSIQRTDNSFGIVSGTGYSTDLLLEDIKAATIVNAQFSNASVYKYNALFGRFNYIWDNKYIINITARRDGSSRFGPENRFHNFGSVGLAWIFSEEKFIKKKLRSISFGKLRSSYGTAGNDQIGDYGYLGMYYPTVSDIAYQNMGGLYTIAFPNPYLQWEKTSKWQMGLDLGFLNNRILLNTTYARNRSSNQLLPYTLPSFTGFGNIFRNFPATVQNTSWEFSFNTTNIKSYKFDWKSSINFTIPRNKLVSFPDLATSSYANSLIVGQPLNTGRVFHFMGVDPVTGLYRAADRHGEPTSSPTYPDDFNVLINRLPKFYGGIQNSFTFKGFQLDVLFQFVKQKGVNNLYYSTGIFAPGVFFSNYSNQPATVVDRWQKVGDDRPVQRYTTSFSYPSLATSSDRRYVDASFIRLKNMSASWNLPDRWLQKMHLQNFNLYLQGQNLFTITRYNGLDPETQSIDVLPPLRTITIGARATL